MLLKIAFRNIRRNGRRSVMTAAAIAIGAVALILFGEYEGMAVEGLETGYVQDLGHLTVYRRGTFAFGSGRPERYSIADYDGLIALITSDRELKPLLNVVTPTVALGGIAGNTAADRSKTFFGAGFVPSAKDKMRRWDEYRLYTTMHYAAFPLTDADRERGIAGKGLAHILALAPGPAWLQLLGGSGGAPNIVTLTLAATQSQSAKELDDAYVGMPLALAQKLAFGGAAKATAIVIQLHRSEDLARARTRLQALFAACGLDLEVHDFKELAPSFGQITGALQTLFAFVSLILFIIVSFTIANTMGMAVMERVSEIGTARAMGARRAAIRRQFLLEGAILGGIGAGVGAIIAIALTFAINHAGITYHMPISASALPLYLMDEGVGHLRGGVFLALVAIAVIASIFPAARAARMKVVDALRHV